MKKLLIFTAVITALTLNMGCNKKDKNDPISVIGSWYSEYDKNDTTRIVQFYQFEDEKTGYWTEFLFCKGSTYPDMQYGSLTGLKDADGAFNYTVGDNGTVRISLLNFSEYDPYDNIWTLKASANKIAGADEGVNYTLVRASEDQIKQVIKWDEDFHGGSAEDEYLYTDITDDPANHPSD